jgi:hypothetical protein
VQTYVRGEDAVRNEGVQWLMSRLPSCFDADLEAQDADTAETEQQRNYKFVNMTQRQLCGVQGPPRAEGTLRPRWCERDGPTWPAGLAACVFVSGPRQNELPEGCEIPPLIDWRSRSLPNWLKPELKPVGMTGPMAPDLVFGAPWRQTTAPLANQCAPTWLNTAFGMAGGIPASRCCQLAG